jgi:hypothetical protein
MQQQEICRPVIDSIFSALQKSGAFIGEAYTHLGIDPEGDDIKNAAKALLEFIQK